MRDVMVDIETLGGKPGSVVASIGAVYFGDDGLGHEFYRVVDVLDSLLAGLRVDDDTLAWWRGQSTEAKAALRAQDARRSLDEALQDFSRFMDQHSGPEWTRVWAKGPDFDLVLLQAAYEAAGQKIPWKYRNARDVRTVLGLVDISSVVIPHAGKHHALADARFQAQQVIAAHVALGVKFASEARRPSRAPSESTNGDAGGGSTP